MLTSLRTLTWPQTQTSFSPSEHDLNQFTMRVSMLLRPRHLHQQMFLCWLFLSVALSEFQVVPPKETVPCSWLCLSF
ncbi:hypothetical protein BS17DRAFT_882772 [Gyrodon lividus]|nr:hypothetical protein BS17DRAFT_882772 [Gyrodon lividus]